MDFFVDPMDHLSLGTDVGKTAITSYSNDNTSTLSLLRTPLLGERRLIGSDGKREEPEDFRAIFLAENPQSQLNTDPPSLKEETRLAAHARNAEGDLDSIFQATLDRGESSLSKDWDSNIEHRPNLLCIEVDPTDQLNKQHPPSISAEIRETKHLR
jgi:hypothetical protein